MAFSSARGAGGAMLVTIVLLAVQFTAPAFAEAASGNRRLLQRPFDGWNSGRFGGQDSWVPPGQSRRGGTASASATAASQGTSDRPNRRYFRPSGYNNWQDALNAQAGSALGRTRNTRRQRIAPTTAQAQAVATSLGGGNAVASAQAIATAASANPGYAAEGIVSAVATAEATSTGGAATATAEAIAQTVAVAPNRAPQVLAQSAALAVSRGYGQAYGRTMANAFAASRRRRQMPQFTQAITQAIAQGGDDSKAAFGQAIATAISQGGDSRAAVAEATATAFCTGGSTAQAWASAYAVALTQNSQGCLVLNEAKALATARCGGGQFAQANAEASATSTVLGFCNVIPPGFLSILGALPSFSTSMSGATATQGGAAFGQGNAFGK